MIHQHGIAKYNYITEKQTTMHKFQVPLEEQPDYACFDPSQSFALVASCEEAVWIDLKNENTPAVLIHK